MRLQKALAYEGRQRASYDNMPMDCTPGRGYLCRKIRGSMLIERSVFFSREQQVDG